VNADLADDTDPYEVQMYQDMVALAKLYGISLRPILFTPFAFGDRTDQGKYPAGDGDALYQQGYNRTYNFVRNFKQDINEWEMGNEINLLATDSGGNRLYGKGWTASEFDMPTMNDWAALLRGMSDAINRINAENHLHLRKTLNTTSTMFGFLDFMASKGVGFDIISYHYYELLGTDPHNYWGGVRPNFDLFKQLATYHRSVVFNEVNCAEIYNLGYENQAGQPVTETGFSSLNATLNYLKNQEDARIESVSIYELLDEPAKAAPEKRFGLNV
jgi:arabinogalactan endo-1,4-beta-galactosidase